jgi:hypothetical protein
MLKPQALPDLELHPVHIQQRPPRPAANFTIGCKPLRWSARVNHQVKALGAIRISNGLAAFHVQLRSRQRSCTEPGTSSGLFLEMLLLNRLLPGLDHCSTKSAVCGAKASPSGKQRTPPLSCLTALPNLATTSGPAALLSTSSKGVSATTPASGPSIVQLTVRGQSPNHEQGRVNSAARFFPKEQRAFAL